MLFIPYYASLIRLVLADAPFPDPERAADLILGTAAQESEFEYMIQIGGGPARGFLQIEKVTEVSIWEDFLRYRSALVSFLESRCGQDGPSDAAREHDMVYGILLARILYFWRDSDPMPAVGDTDGQAHRWKQYYNTAGGAGSEQEYVDHYAQLIQPYREQGLIP